MSATYLDCGISPTAPLAVPSQEGSGSAVSWGAIIAGALTAIVSTLVLVILGTGLGLSMVSPWKNIGASAAAAGISTVIGLIVVQWLSSAFGGFVAGRLRTKWVGIHNDEVFFRDTAHGFLAWALSSLIGLLIAGSLTASGIGGAAKSVADVGAGAASGVANSASSSPSNASGYFVDTMFRSTNSADGNKTDSRGETLRILSNSTHDGQVSVSPDDRTYLAQMIAARTGISEADADQRVDTTVKQINDAEQKAAQAADSARKAAAHFSITLALSMVVGAFIASVAAALGGNVREE